MGLSDLEPGTRAAVDAVFGERAECAGHFVDLLAQHGVERGLIGPREVDRLWERHVLNSGVIAELIPRDARVLDVGTGAGFPGIPLAIARPDLEVVLLEPMERRTTWLAEVAARLELPLTIERGRAEEKSIRNRLGGMDAVTARAVAPLARLAEWCLPLLRPLGMLLALKGASAPEEIERDRAAVRGAGGGPPRITRCGADILETPSTVVTVERVETRRRGPVR